MHAVRADRTDDEVARRGLDDWPARGERIGRGAGRARDDHAVSRHIEQPSLLGPNVEPDHAGHRSAGHDRLVERKVGVDDAPLAHHADVEHHAALDRVFFVHQLAEAAKLLLLQLRHEAERAEVHAEHRNVAVRRGLGKVQDRAVAAEGDDHVRAAQLLLERTDIEAVALGLLLVAERHAHDVRTVNAVENALGLLGDGQLMVAVGVWTKYYLFKHRFRLSFPPAPRGTPRPEPSGHGPAAPPPHGRDSRDIQCSPRGREWESTSGQGR